MTVKEVLDKFVEAGTIKIEENQSSDFCPLKTRVNGLCPLQVATGSYYSMNYPKVAIEKGLSSYETNAIME